MDVSQIITIISQVIAGSSALLFGYSKFVAPYTKSTKDDKIVNSVIKFIKMVSLHVDDNHVVIDIKKK